MALSANVLNYVNRNIKALESQGADNVYTSDNYELRGYVGSDKCISGEEADKRTMRIMDGWR
jgi:uncharacterized protein YvpB